MRIGHLPVDPPVLLAPMAAVTDLPFRTICDKGSSSATYQRIAAGSGGLPPGRSGSGESGSGASRVHSDDFAL